MTEPENNAARAGRDAAVEQVSPPQTGQSSHGNGIVLQAPGAGLSSTENVEETVRLLDLFASQIEATINEGDTAVEDLTCSFTAIVNSSQAIARVMREGGDPTAVRAAVMQHCKVISDKVQTAIVAFQFYDRLTQQLGHVRDGLSTVAGRVSGDAEAAEQSWREVHERIRGRYTMERERVMFDLLVGGLGVDEALEQRGDGGATSSEAGNIDLF